MSKIDESKTVSTGHANARWRRMREEARAVAARGVCCYVFAVAQAGDDKHSAPREREIAPGSDGNRFTLVTCRGTSEECTRQMFEDLEVRVRNGTVGVLCIPHYERLAASPAVEEMLPVLGQHEIVLLAGRRLYKLSEPRHERFLRQRAFSRSAAAVFPA